MRYLKLFENFGDNKEVIDTLKKILNCIKNGKMITSVLNGGTLIDLHDKCGEEEEEVKSFLLKSSEIAGDEIQGKQVDLKTQFDANELEGLITKLEGNPEKDEPKMKLNESHNKSISITEEEMNLFSQEAALQKLISDNKISLLDKKVSFDENDVKTKEILDQYLEIPGKVEESITLKKIKKFNQFLNENIELSNSSARIYIDSDEADMFKTEPDLQKLVSDKKVSILIPDIWFESEDKETIDILKRYFPDNQFPIEEDEEEEDDSEDFDDYYY